MKNAVFYNLAVTSILSTLMLELGNDQENGQFLSVIAFLSILSGLILTDITKIFAISEKFCNFLIIIVLFFHIGPLIQSPTNFLAFSIANLLVYIQLILFFKRKDLRVCYHLLILSFIQVSVGCVFDQSLLFAFLLILYSFGLAGGLSLLSLNHDKLYYEKHSFLRRSFQKEKKVNRSLSQTILRIWGRFLSLIRLKPFSSPSTFENRKTSKRSPLSLLNNSLDEPNLDYWEEVDSDSVSFASIGIHFVAFPKKNIAPELPKTRLPLLYQRPSFSGSRRSGRAFPISRELLFRLAQGTVFSLLLALVIFCLFPRLTNIEIGTIRFGYENWRSSKMSTAIQNTVGFNETVKLGELGPIGDNHKSVMTIGFRNVRNNSEETVPVGTTVYLRGVTMVGYKDRQWSRIESKVRGSQLIGGKEAGQLFPSTFLKNPNSALFDSRNDLILQEIVLKPLSSPVVFSVWPFFRVSQRRDQNRLLAFDFERFIRTKEEIRNNFRLQLYTNAFRNGQQVEIIPNQENCNDYSIKQMLEMNEKSLSGLVKLAQSWDNASNLPKEDYIGRAKNIEKQLRDSGHFSYSRSGIARNRHIDPLEDFVINHPQGHCEYFAGALVMMLRAIGIPSRMVIGFKFETNPNKSGISTVCQSDAHTWVEAYIPNNIIEKNEQLSIIDTEKEAWWVNGGWLRLDATPHIDAPLLTSVSKSYQSWNEWLKFIWFDYFLNFNQHRQNQTFYQPIWNTVQNWFATFSKMNWNRQLFTKIGERITYFFQAIREGKWNDREFIQTAMGIGLFFLIFYFGMKWLLFRLFYCFNSKKKRLEKKEIAIQFYKQLEQLIMRYGMVRLPSETPLELVYRFAQTTNQWDKLLTSQNELPVEQQELIDFYSNQFSERTNEISDKILLSEPVEHEKESNPKDLITNNYAVYLKYFPEEKKRFILLKLLLTIVEDYYRIHFGGESVSETEMKKIHSILNLLGAYT